MKGIPFSQCPSIVTFWLLLGQGGVYLFHNVHPLLHFGYCLLGKGHTVFTMSIHCYILVTACSGRGIPFSQCASIVTFWLLLSQGRVYRFHNVHPLLHFGYCLLDEGYTVFTMSVHCYILVTACSARGIPFSQCPSIVTFWLLLAQGGVYRFHNVHPLLHLVTACSGKGIPFSQCPSIVTFWLLLARREVYGIHNVRPLLHFRYCLLGEGYTVFTMSIHCYILVTACSGRGIPFSQCASIVTFWLLLARQGAYRFHNVHPLFHFGYCLLREGYTVFTMSIHCYILVTACSGRGIPFSQCPSIVTFWLLLAKGGVYCFHNVHPLLHFGYCLLWEGYTVFTMCIHCYILVTDCSVRDIPFS